MPVKHYSQGMYLRLAFSVAFHFEMDILVLDEILAVGDNAFKDKCFSSLLNLIKEGKSIIIVSHDMEVISNLCTSCLWLENGTIKLAGEPHSIVEKYLNATLVSSSLNDLHLEAINAPQAHITSSSDNKFISVDDELIISIELEKKIETGNIQLFLELFNTYGVRLFSDSPSLREQNDEKMQKGTYKYMCVIPKKWLSKGVYKVGIKVIANGKKIVYENQSAAFFKILPSTSETNQLNDMSGSLHPTLIWKITHDVVKPV